MPQGWVGVLGHEWVTCQPHSGTAQGGILWVHESPKGQITAWQGGSQGLAGRLLLHFLAVSGFE